jgi:hypothetical protein
MAEQSTTVAVLKSTLKPFSFIMIMWPPVGTCTRARENCPVDFPSIKISAPEGVVVTWARAR